MKKFSRHMPHYVGLIGIFVIGIIGFSIFSYDKSFQIAIVIALGSAYFAWGLVHHFIHRDLTWGMAIEYLTFSVLGVLLALGAMRLI